MKAKLIIEFTDKLVELVKEESGYTSPEAVAAYLQGIYAAEFAGSGSEEFIENYRVEVE